MPLLSLPPELIFHILTFTSYPSVLSFLSTTPFITTHLLSPSSIRLLRRTFVANLLAWETAARSARAWPLVSDPIKGPWTLQASTYGESMYLFWLQEGDEFFHIPCYGCVRFRQWDQFGSSMRSGGRMVGQVRADRRRCVPCGIRAGLYRGGARIAMRSVCVRCTHLMVPMNGVRCDEDSPETVGGKEPYAFQGVVGLRGGGSEGFGKRISESEVGENFWWWTYSHMCVRCTREEGYTVRDLLHARPIKDRMVRRMKARHAEKRIASLERGRLVRARLGIPEPEPPIDIEALKRMDDPFPKFQPTPVVKWLPEMTPELEAELFGSFLVKGTTLEPTNNTHSTTTLPPG